MIINSTIFIYYLNFWDKWRYITVLILLQNLIIVPYSLDFLLKIQLCGYLTKKYATILWEKNHM